MCFSNLPIEFDEEGNPYLTEEADEGDGLPDAECRCTEDVPLSEADPEAVYDDILETMPTDVRERIADRAGARSDGRERSTSEQSAGGD